MDKIKSESKCLFCDKTFAKASINRHLQKHLSEKSLHNKPGKSFLLKIETNPRWGASPYFLSIWIDGEATMGVLDTFLRQIWLECCGHMSAFVLSAKKRQGGGMLDIMDAYELLDKGKVKEYEEIMEDVNGQVPLSRKTKNVFQKDLKLQYRYDFGSTTELQLTVVNDYPVKADQDLVLLSRNEPLELLCEKCDKSPAILICSVCNDYEDEGMFCSKCAKKHAKSCEDFDDYAAMPVVNSPRMGICGYGGGHVDVERDGIFLKP